MSQASVFRVSCNILRHKFIGQCYVTRVSTHSPITCCMWIPGSLLLTELNSAIRYYAQIRNHIGRPNSSITVDLQWPWIKRPVPYFILMAYTSQRRSYIWPLTIKLKGHSIWRLISRRGANTNRKSHTGSAITPLHLTKETFFVKVCVLSKSGVRPCYHYSQIGN